jgi:hypothetical protein
MLVKFSINFLFIKYDITVEIFRNMCMHILQIKHIIKNLAEINQSVEDLRIRLLHKNICKAEKWMD